MFVELRRNLQTIIPKRIAADLGLEVGDRVEVTEKDGVILVVPVAKTEYGYNNENEVQQ